MAVAEEKDYQRWLKDQEYQRQLERERYERKQAKSHLNCPFFRYCWNEGLKLPTRHDCPKYNNQYWGLGNHKPTAGLSMLKMHISTDEYREIRRRRDEQKSRYEQGGTSKIGTTKPRVTSWILLNKWQ